MSSPVHFEIVSAGPHHDCCRYPSCKVKVPPQPPTYLKREFEQKSLETPLNEVFIKYNLVWYVKQHTEMFFELAVCYFLRRMKVAGCSGQEAEKFVEYTVRNLTADDDFESIINVEILREWENLIR